MTRIYPGRIIEWGKPMELREKELLLGGERIVKAVYFQDESGIYGCALPFSYQVERKKLSDALGFSKKRAKYLHMASTFPLGQVPGTLTPFIVPEDLTLVRSILFHEIDLEGIVDFAYPGDTARSIQVAYEEAIGFLTKQYPSLVTVRDIAKPKSIYSNEGSTKNNEVSLD